MDAVEDQIGDRSGKRGRKVSTAPMEENVFTRTRMDPHAYWDTMRNLLPDPDEIWRKGLIGYADLYSLARDAHASSCLQQRKSQTLSHRIQIRPGEGASGPLAEQAYKVCARMLATWGNEGRRDFISKALDAKLVGMQPFELNWAFDNEVGGLLVRRPRDLLQEWFAYSPDGFLRVKKPNGIDTEPAPPFKILNVRNEPSTRNPYGVKLLSPCYWPVTFKRGGMRFFSEYAEKFGMPTMMVKAPSGTAITTLKRFVSDLAGMMRKGIIATKGEYDVQNLDMDSKYQTTHMYGEFMDTMDQETSKALLGQTLTTSEGGSRAQGDIHKQILETIWKSDDEFVAGAMTNMFELVTYVNFGREVVPPIAIVGESLGIERMERDKVLRDYHGIELSDTYFERHYSLQVGDYKRVDPLKASYKDLPDSGVSPSKGGSRKSEAAKDSKEKRENHRNR